MYLTYWGKTDEWTTNYAGESICEYSRKEKTMFILNILKKWSFQRNVAKNVWAEEGNKQR